jgi:hypothetical protein
MVHFSSSYSSSLYHVVLALLLGFVAFHCLINIVKSGSSVAVVTGSDFRQERRFLSSSLRPDQFWGSPVLRIESGPTARSAVGQCLTVATYGHVVSNVKKGWSSTSTWE